MGSDSFEEIVVNRQEREVPKPTLTSFQGGVVTFGSELDSLQSCLRLRPAVGKKDGLKAALNAGRVLRFEAVMISTRAFLFCLFDRMTEHFTNLMLYINEYCSTGPEDATRRFVVAFELADDTVGVFEERVRNSGIWGGKFLERVPLKNEATGKPFVKQDFVVGQEITINSYVVTHILFFMVDYIFHYDLILRYNLRNDSDFYSNLC